MSRSAAASSASSAAASAAGSPHSLPAPARTASRRAAADSQADVEIPARAAATSAISSAVRSSDRVTLRVAIPFTVPPAGPHVTRGAAPADAQPDPPDTGAATFHVRHGTELFGALTVHRDSPLTPTEERLVADLAAQAGIVLRNTVLVTQLQEAAARLVTVQDTTRRRLERDLHDGAQQHLTALAMKVGMARSLTDPRAIGSLLDELAVDSAAALDELRELARGLFPPLLSAHGLRAVLAARCRRMPVPTRLSCPPDRYPAEIEIAVYFCCVEALQNAASHSDAQRIDVRVWPDDRNLRLVVSDDGHGFTPAAVDTASSGLQGMRDRLAARAGGLDVISSPGCGTRIEGWVPVPRPDSGKDTGRE